MKPEAPLVGGFYLTILGLEKPRWIECRYNRVYKFCRACGMVGHTYSQCGLPRAEARAHVNEAVNRLAAQFQTVVRTDDRMPLYSNRTRAFARSNSRRNNHMWAAIQDLYSHEDLSERGVVNRALLLESGEDVGEPRSLAEMESQTEEDSQTEMDYEQFLANY